MKKMVLMVVFVLSVYGQIFAQSQPIMGYDKVKWGATVLDVRKAYNLGNSYVLQERYNNDPNVAALIQKNVSDSIKERTFLFNKWKGNYQLYHVWVEYWDDSTVQNLLIGLAGRYGDRTDFKKDSEHQFNDWYKYTDTSTFGKYSPELIVELFHVYTNWAGGGGLVIVDGSGKTVMNLGSSDVGINIPVPLQVCYTWKKFRDEYQARNVQF